MRDHDVSGWAPAVVRDVGEDDSGVYVIGIRETTEADAWSLLFMECYDADDEQEIDLDMNTYCLVVDPGQATYYGGVRECVLAGGRLRLRLTEDAALTLGMPVDAMLVLDVAPEQIDLLARGLTRVLTSGSPAARPELLVMP
ncbi:Imm10 family immunity protein [Catellatospora sp. NPDC049111]|uniref:Imm10 family immunity protein n=1 Tax=Catellatospora sp. NPDC049111 TaxID=3155271 RepID=UPI0033D48B4D